MAGRTITIGDIHGDLVALEVLLERLPALDAEDTLVFLGDYVDRGIDSRGVIEKVQQVVTDSPARVITLRGNHEDLWLTCFDEPNLGFLLPRGNGCYETFRSFTGLPPLEPGSDIPREDLEKLLHVKGWFPKDIVEWMASLPVWFEDDHGIYVHAGLDGEADEWKHPRDCRPRVLMWSRDPDFFRGYKGKRLLFGHTRVCDLPNDHLGPGYQPSDEPDGIWVRGDLVGIDTGCGKGGFLSAIELPSMTVYESR